MQYSIYSSFILITNDKMKHNDELSSWMEELILKFREEYEKLSNEEKDGLLDFDNLNKPCQVEIIRIRDKELNTYFQFHYFTKLKDEKDLNIEVKVVDSRNYIDFLDEYLENKRIILLSKNNDSSFINKNEEYLTLKLNFADGIDLFNGHVESLRSGIKVYPSITNKMELENNSFLWFSEGKIEETKTSKIIDSIISVTKQLAKLKVKEIPYRKEMFMDGFGTYFYPPIWIGEFNSSLKDIAHRTLLLQLRKKIHNINYKGKLLVVYNDGFIAIRENNRKEATKVLNEIMATAIFLGIPASKVNEPDLAKVEINRENLMLTSQSMPPNSIRTHLIHSQSSIEEEFNRIKLPEQKIIEVLSIAEKLTNDEVYVNFLIFYLDSFTFFQNHFYSQSFIMSWLIIERYLSLLWKREVIDKTKGKQKREFKNHDRWSAYYIIETLTLLGIIRTNEKYKTLVKLKRKRDRIVHRGEECSKKEAEECLNLAKILFTEKLE